MKKFRRITTTIAATLMVATLSVPMAASLPASAASITITNIDASTEHNFEVYQVFSGDWDAIASNLTEIKWGNGVTHYNVSGTDTAVTAGGEVDISIINAVNSDGARETIDKLTFTTTDAYIKKVSSKSDSLEIVGLDPGYYVVKDVTDFDNQDEANSAWMVDVAGGDTTTTINIKNAKPTVDKEVLDIDGTTETWGESADHAINTKFDFKLVATIPEDTHLSAYDTYKLEFNDSMSAGVTYNGIKGVRVYEEADDTNIKIINTDKYDITGVAKGEAGAAWTLSIDNLKDFLPEGTTLGGNKLIVEVIYEAYLNENAITFKDSINAGDHTQVNNNKVSLKYSNNPDSTGTGSSLGKTPDDYVWVFSYDVLNTKYKNSKNDGNELAGAKFKLYSGPETEITDGSVPIEFVFENGNYIPSLEGTDTELISTELISDADGLFNIKGLDAGTYTLVETYAPDGYTKCDNIVITIDADHSENTDGTTANLDLTRSSNLVNEVVNKFGATLPGTGGIGTTLFYIGGGCMVGIAGIYLISKKRMKKEEA